MGAHYHIDNNGAGIAGSREYFNRVLYGGHEKDDQQERFFTFAGDAPLFMGAVSDFTRDTWCYQAKNGLLVSGAALTPGHVEGGHKDNFSLWFHNSSDIITRWHNGYLSYELSRMSPYFPDLRVKMSVYPLNPGDGFAVEYELFCDQRVIFCAGFGGITPFFGRFEYYNSANREFSIDDCKDNAVVITGSGAEISGPCDTVLRIGDTLGCSYVADAPEALLEKHPSMFLTSHAGNAGVVKLQREIAPGETVRGRIVVVRNDNDGLLERYLAMENCEQFLRNQVRQKYSGTSLHTPDGALNSIFRDLITAQDAAFHGRSFYHGAVGYHAPFLGWRGWYAPTLLNWKERVRAAVNSHFDSIMRSNGVEKVWWDGGDRPDLDHEGTQYHHLENSSGFLPALLHRNDIYDMQEVALDMTLHYLDYSGDMETAGAVIDRIDEILDWEERILDPDGDGLYQNFLNTWISDGHSYNGGGCAQASCYNYRANRIAACLAEKLNLPELKQKFAARTEKIRQAFMTKLWQEKSGIPAEFIDTIGNKLLHPSPELSTVYLASEADILPDQTAAFRALKFVDNAIKSVTTGQRNGKLYFSSGWLPKKYSTCGIFPAENAALALAFYKNGQPEKGFEIISAIVDGFEMSLHPGAVSHVFTALGGEDGGDLDFTDVSSCVLRMLIEGLWGWRREYSENRCIIAPQLPKLWEHAAITLPEFYCSFHGSSSVDHYSFTENSELEKTFILPLRHGGCDGVMLNGKSVEYSLVARPGGSAVKVVVSGSGNFDFELYNNICDKLPELKQNKLSVYPGNLFDIALTCGSVCKVDDPAGIAVPVDNGVWSIAENAGGQAMLLIHAESVCGTPVLLPLEIEVNQLCTVPADIPEYPLQMIDLDGIYNCALTEIHQQDFVSPRPAGYSIGMRKNGRYAWEWNHFGHNAVKVDDHLLRECGGKFTTGKGESFKVASDGKNAACVSIWDNFPTSLQIPLPQKEAGRVKVLLCGTTNAMQSYVVNGRLSVRCKDGAEYILELIHPVNFDDFLVPALQQSFEYVYIGEGTHAIVAEIILAPEAIPEMLTIEAVANEVIISVLGVSCC